MENIITHSSFKSIQGFIDSFKKAYYISVDTNNMVKLYSPNNRLLDYTILDSLYLKHTEIQPIYTVIKNIKSSYVIKVTIPSFSIIFPQFNNISYTFNESSLDIILKLPPNTLSFSNIEDFFDNGIKNYLKRTLSGIFSQNFISSNKYSLLCEEYHCSIKSIDKENDCTYV